MDKSVKIIPMSKEAEDRISVLAEELKGKVLFPEKVEEAKRSIKGLKSLPI